MHINITKSETGNNKGSSSQLVAYLEKENRQAELLDKNYTPEYWFNNIANDIQSYEVRTRIDNNIAKLSKDDAKFFLINISPSEKELRYLKELYGDDSANEALKQYANEVMNAYAKNFKRNGVDRNDDLVYFGKVENSRYYSYKDLEVRKGLAKKGQAKPGEQMHVQVIISRKDKTNSIKLSPLNNSKGKNAEHSLKVGQFDRIAFKRQAEKLFDGLFDYDRSLQESFNYANTMKNGDYDQRQEMKDQLQAERIIAHGEQVEQSIQVNFVEKIGIQISDDIDDEAILGRNRHRKRQARTNTR
jgi:hypothetical protein